MADTDEGRVAVYIDFDNIVISRYDQVHGRSQFQRDRQQRGFDGESTDPEIAERLAAATVEVGAIIDFASSFGTLVLTRAYADWSARVNADYRGQLVARAVDLVQLFPAAAYAKNGADIRLAVDAVEDMFRLPDLSHVIIVAGDSDYIALAQRCRRLGRYVVGIGVAGSTSRALSAACDEFVTYDALPGVTAPVQPVREVAEDAPGQVKRGRRAKSAPPPEEDQHENEDTLRTDAQDDATLLLRRALRIGHEKNDAEWLHSSAVKTQMKRMDPSFSEKSLGFRSFSDFIKSRDSVAELDDSSTAQMIRLVGSRD